jgi:uncharacterized phage protein (TIGR01671 family)
MEDRYLFKGKRLDNGEWAEGLPSYDEDGEIEEIEVWDGEDIAFYPVFPGTICQCTGLKDKNGKLIWENDIIECKDGKRNFQTQIEWDAYCAGFIFQDAETSAVGLDAITANGLYSESKVIGNIFDDKELLESEEN